MTYRESILQDIEDMKRILQQESFFGPYLAAVSIETAETLGVIDEKGQIVGDAEIDENGVVWINTSV